MSFNVVFFTEMPFIGKIKRDHPNMRTEFAWMCALQADHFPLKHILEHQGSYYNKKYDLGIVITPKKEPNIGNVKKFKNVCEKVAIMQEGPNWYYQDYSLDLQINYYNNLCDSDFIFCHNLIDKVYYEGLTNHSKVYVLPSLMIEDSIKGIREVEKSGVMIGGNFVSWYGGFDSYVLASKFFDKKEIFGPKMGRAIAGESNLLNQLPYVQWDNWMIELSKRKLGIHLMRTHAAGTFALNCSYLGIPCIGYSELDTQRILHPKTTVKNCDLYHASHIVEELLEDVDFYKYNSKLTKELYHEFYSEKVWLNNFYNIFKV